MSTSKRIDNQGGGPAAPELAMPMEGSHVFNAPPGNELIQALDYNLMCLPASFRRTATIIRPRSTSTRKEDKGRRPEKTVPFSSKYQTAQTVFPYRIAQPEEVKLLLDFFLFEFM